MVEYIRCFLKFHLKNIRPHRFLFSLTFHCYPSTTGYALRLEGIVYLPAKRDMYGMKRLFLHILEAQSVYINIFQHPLNIVPGF